MVLIMVLLVVSLLKLIELMVLRMFFPVIVLSRMDVGSELGDLVGCEVLMRIAGYCMLVDPFTCNTCSCWLVVKLKIKTICILPGTLDGIVHGPTQIMVRCGFPWLMKTRIPKTPAPQEPEVLRVQKQLQAPSLDPRISLRNLSGYVHFVFLVQWGRNSMSALHTSQKASWQFIMHLQFSMLSVRVPISSCIRHQNLHCCL